MFAEDADPKEVSAAPVVAAPVPALPVAPLGVAGKLRWHLVTVFGPGSLASDVFQAGVLHLNDDPHEWEQGSVGYGRRYGSQIGYDLVRNSMMFTLNAALRQDPRYRPSEWQGRKEIRKRSWHAIKQVAVAQTDGGRRLPAFVRLGSTFGTAFLSNTWQPTRLADTQHAVVRGFVTLSADVGINAFQEFWPDIKTHLFRRKPKTP